MAWTSPRTWVAGEKPPAATLNTHIRDNFKAIGDPWTSYTPTLSNVTLGTGGTATGKFQQAGKTVLGWSVQITLGTGGALTGTFGMLLPATPISVVTNQPFGTASLFDSSAPAVIHGTVRMGNLGNNVFIAWNAATPTTSVLTAAAQPWTWAAGDIIFVTGSPYEAA